uniref:Uncharacterized protein n=1 Tax=Leersia perrieri TaxID=77586 RepID=A0A0D9VHD1_9ORYZ
MMLLQSSFCYGGQCFSASLCENGMGSKQSGRASPPGLTGGPIGLRRHLFRPPAAIVADGVEKMFEARGNNEGSQQATSRNNELQASIRKQLHSVELSPSPYDTAWVAMVPLRGSSQTPCFPKCVDWILQNQQDDGSWSINAFKPTVDKDILSSTLACVLALQKWNVGSEHIRKGLNFIGRNFSIAMDEETVAPIGFGVIFPTMLNLANGTGLELPVKQTDIDRLTQLREIEIEREAGDHSLGRKAYKAYVAEGFGNLLDWNETMKFQRKNGSLLNCPSSTAAALINHHDDKALQYLKTLVVPTLYPLNIYCQLSMVDTLEKMGISQYFVSEIKSILDMTYSSWLQGDEEIMLDITTCAMAFRLLRMNGYDISSDELSHVAEASSFRDSLQGYLNDTKSILELYKASQIEYALKYPFYSTLDRINHKRNIKHFDDKCSQMLKTEFKPVHANQDFLAFAADDFRTSQSNYQNELNYLESWVKENRLDQLKFARQKITYCYLSGAATVFPPEMSDARTSWAKTAWLTAVVDDLLDVGGSKEERENIMELVEKWDDYRQVGFYSEDVQIVFEALYTTVNQIGAKASALQGHDVTKYLVETWRHILRCMMIEAEWQSSQYVPTFEEYMEYGMASLGQGATVMSALFLIGVNLPEDIVRHPEYNKLFRLMGTCGRLLNDIQGIEREEMDGKMINGVSLIRRSGGSMSVDDAIKEVYNRINTSRRELFKLVHREKGVVPRPCRQLFWKMCKILHLFYFQTDGFSSPKEMVSAVNAVIKEPLELRSKYWLAINKKL